MQQIDTPPPAGNPDERSWHRHPALIAAIPAVFTLVGSVLTIVLGQADVLPSAINPAPPPTTVLTTQTATTTATATVTETVTETPTVQITDPGGTSTPATIAPGTLAITVQVNSAGKIGPGEYRAGAFANAVAQVLDETGHYPGTNCYPTWVLKRGAATIKSGRSGSCREAFYFDSNSLEVRGIYHLTVSVVTEAGAKGTKTEDFKVS